MGKQTGYGEVGVNDENGGSIESDGIQDIINKLAIIYGDNVNIIAERILITHDGLRDAPIYNGMRNDDSSCLKDCIVFKYDGEILFNNIDIAVPIYNTQLKRDIGCAVFLDKTLNKYYEQPQSGRLTVIGIDFNISKGIIIASKYNDIRPEMILKYEHTRYVGQFDERGILERFISIRG